MLFGGEQKLMGSGQEGEYKVLLSEKLYHMMNSKINEIKL